MKNHYKLFFIVFTLLACKSYQQVTQDPPFKIEKATFRSWVGGQPGVSGTIVTFEIKEIEKGVQLDSVYFKGKVTSIEIDENSKGTIRGHFDTSTIREPYENTNKQNPSVIKTPLELKGNEALLQYHLKKKKYYYKVLVSREKSALSFPKIP